MGYDNQISMWLRDALYWFQSWMGEHPTLYYGMFARRHPFSRMRVTAQTRVCIEGFPRSANSYAVVAFKLANPEVPIAHHLHVPAQILKAVAYHIPTVLVVRSPLECVPSFMVFQRSTNATFYLQAYIRFHQKLFPVLSQVLVVDFQQVVSDFNQVILAMNERFQTQFHLIENLPAQQSRIFSRLEEINHQFFKGDQFKSMKPDASRKAHKEKVKQMVASHPLLPDAMAVYQQIAAFSPFGEITSGVQE